MSNLYTLFILMCLSLHYIDFTSLSLHINIVWLTDYIYIKIIFLFSVWILLVTKLGLIYRVSQRKFKLEFWTQLQFIYFSYFHFYIGNWWIPYLSFSRAFSSIDGSIMEDFENFWGRGLTWGIASIKLIFGSLLLVSLLLLYLEVSKYPQIHYQNSSLSLQTWCQAMMS